jgi:predicted CoA-binding protein
MVTGTATPVDVLKKSKTVAVVGASNTPEKEAYTVPRYLKEHGYKIIPVNPSATEIQGEKSYPTLLDIPEDVARTIDVVEVFRPSAELPKVALQAVELKKRNGRPVIFWAQQGLENDEAKRILDDNGIQYVMDACMRALHKIYIR